MKKYLVALGLLPITSHAGVSFTGAALLNPTGVSSGDFGIVIVDTTGAGFDSIKFEVGASLLDGASYAPHIEVVNSGASASEFLGSITVSGNSSFSLTSEITQGDRFAIIVFSNSTSTALDGDSYSIWTSESWVVPADGSAYTFTAGAVGAAQLPSLSGAPTFTGTIIGSAIPEPASFAALAGLGMLGLASMRRRRAA